MQSIIGRIEGGTLSKDKWIEVKEAFKPYEGTIVELIVSDAESGTGPQTRYWWKVIVPIYAEAMGDHDTKSVHASILEHLLPEECSRNVNIFTGRETVQRPSWAAMTKERRSIAIDRAISFAWTWFKITIPPPDAA